MKLNKKQKRTATIASMAALLAVVLGMGGQTFAKYISTYSQPAETATVAKWGVVINTTVEGNDANAPVSVFSNNYDNLVVAADDRDVVAPGTKGTYGLLITGTPEVKTLVSVTLEITDIHVSIGGVDYYPIVWTYNDVDYNGVTGEKSVSKMIENIKMDKVEYAANTNMKDINVNLSWKWAFDNSTINTNADKYDTILGDLAANNETSASKFDDPATVEVETNALATAVTSLSVKLSATVEQAEA